MSPSTKLYIILGITILIWGNSFVVVQIAINEGASPTLIAMGRFLVASSIFGGYVVLRRPAWIDRSDLRLFLFLAFVGIGVYYIFQYYGVRLAGPSITSILVTLLCPIMIFALSYFRLGERVSGEQKLGLGISAVGSYLVITDGTTEFLSDWQSLLGGLFAVICAALWAYYTVEGKKVVRRYDPFVSTAYIALIGTIMLVPSALVEVRLAGPVDITLGYVAAVLYLGILCTVVGYVFWFRALAGFTASSTGATLYFEPVVTIVFAWIILGQGIGWLAAIGGILVMVGVILVSRR